MRLAGVSFSCNENVECQCRFKRHDGLSTVADVAAAHPLRETFARLTRLEEAKRLYTDISRTGTRDGWRAVLATNGLRLAGHRIVRP